MTNEKQQNMEALSQLFKADSRSAVFGGANQLDKTAQLTSLATEITGKILEVITSQPEELEGQVLASQKDHDAMDDLIQQVHPFRNENEPLVDVDFLRGTDEEEIDKMIRSQQSKRSRAKSKTMTLDNYRTMMIGAVAENLLRFASGKQKSAGGGAVMGDVGYTEDELEKLAADPEALKKAIRNIQSKKSILKSKAEFEAEGGEESDRWQQLLAAEKQLKELRDAGSAAMNEEAKKALETKQKAEQLLAEVDTENLSPEEAAKLLNSVKEMLAAK